MQNDIPERIRKTRRLLDEMETLLRRVRRTLLNRRNARGDRRVAVRARITDRRGPAAAG
jgi:hypothetical protein